MNNDSITITGTAETVLPLQTFDSGFKKRVLVINTGGDYPQTIPVEFTKDKTALLDDIKDGQMVTAYVNLRGNEFKGKYYANIQGWKLDTESQDLPEPQPKATASASPAPATTHQLAEDDDQIPF